MKNIYFNNRFSKPFAGFVILSLTLFQLFSVGFFIAPKTALANTTSALVPVGNGHYTSWTGDYTDVNEGTSGSADCSSDDSIKSTGSDSKESFTLNLSSIPNGSTITSVSITVRDRGEDDPEGTYQTLIRLNGVDTNSGTNLSAGGGSGDPCSSAKTQIINVAATTKSGTTTLEIGVIKINSTGHANRTVRIGAISAIINYTLAPAEICNGIDDDQDGQIDEGGVCPTINYYCDGDQDTYYSIALSGTCNSYNCVPSGCVTQSGNDCNDSNLNIHPNATEICNGVDDDCDGNIDENLTQPTTCGLGACSGNTGIETCTAGGWGGNTCDAFDGAGAEICDAQFVDENCDGTPNEGCECVNGAQSSCGSDVGECVAGIQTCIDGALGECDGVVYPADEVCDGLDNNCDGNIDEGGVCPTTPYYCDNDQDTYLSATLSDTCSTYNCVPFLCRALIPGDDCNDGSAGINPGATEICGNGIDEDCNGSDLTCPVEICTDGSDNDGDLAIDCDDSDCANDPACQEVPGYCGDGDVNSYGEQCDGTDMGQADSENYFCSVNCQLVPIYDGQHSCPEGTIKSSEPIITQQISSIDPDGEIINIGIGGRLLEVIGTFTPTTAPGYLSDAGYTTINGIVAPQYGIHGTPPDYAGHALLSDFGTGTVGVVDWGEYNPDHIYTKYYNAQNENGTQFVIGDRYDNWFNTPYQNQTGMEDNSGSLTLNIYECMAPATGTVSGHKYNDLDEDGIFDEQEPGLGGWNVWIDLNDNGVFDGNDWQTTTDGSNGGLYAFPPVPVGTYDVCEIMENHDGWTTENLVCQEVVVTENQTSTVDFFNYQVCNPDINLITNGGFEEPVVETDALWNIFNSGLTNWVASWMYEGPTQWGEQEIPRPETASLQLLRGFSQWGAHSGQQYAELDSSWFSPSNPIDSNNPIDAPSATTIYQDIPTIPGENYTVTFWFSARPETDATDNVLRFDWNESTIANNITAGGGTDGTVWTEYTYTLPATSSTTRIQFSDLGLPSDGFGTFLDGVSVRCRPTECTYEQTQSCAYDGLGVCAVGLQTCGETGFWGSCMQNVFSTTEICTGGLDEDCDGLVDCADTADCSQNAACQPAPTGGGGGGGGTPGPYISICGNGISEPGEQCDDGNLINGDGCSSVCAIEQVAGATTEQQGGGEQTGTGQQGEEVLGLGTGAPSQPTEEGANNEEQTPPEETPAPTGEVAGEEAAVGHNFPWWIVILALLLIIILYLIFRKKKGIPKP